MDATETVAAYYDALRSGEPLHPFFATGAGVTKFGISEARMDADAVAAGLREQTDTTENWRFESRDLQVTERDCHAWFRDRGTLTWTETGSGIRHSFETRWSGTLERAADWRFVTMHVSAPHDLSVPNR